MLLHGKFNQTTSLTYTVSSRFWKQHAIISKTVCYKQNCFCLYCTISLINHSSSFIFQVYFPDTCSSSKQINAQQVHKRSTRTTSYHPLLHSGLADPKTLREKKSFRFGYWGPKGWRNHEKFHQTTPPMFGLCTSVCSAKEADENTHFSGLSRRNEDCEWHDGQGLTNNLEKTEENCDQNGSRRSRILRYQYTFQYFSDLFLVKNLQINRKPEANLGRG